MIWKFRPLEDTQAYRSTRSYSFFARIIHLLKISQYDNSIKKQ